jgi:hypothetical protein
MDACITQGIDEEIVLYFVDVTFTPIEIRSWQQGI